MTLRKLILENFNEAAAEFTQLAGNPAEVNQAIETFKNLVNQEVFTGKEQNINYWRSQGWKTFRDTVAQLSQNPEAVQPPDQESQSFKDARSQLQALLNAPQLDHKAIVPLLLSSKDGYSATLYIQKYSELSKKPVSVPDAIIISALYRYRDSSAADTSVITNMIDFSNISNNTVSTMVKEMPGVVGNIYDKLTTQQQSVVQKNPKVIRTLIYKNKKPMPALEDTIATDATNAQEYAELCLGGKPFKKGEAVIAKDPIRAGSYAYHSLNGKRFPEGEKAIATDPMMAYQYAQHNIKGEWPEGEKAIAKSGQYSYAYSMFVTRKRFPAGEAAMAESGHWSKYNSIIEKLEKDQKDQDDYDKNQTDKQARSKAEFEKLEKDRVAQQASPPPAEEVPPTNTIQPPLSTDNQQSLLPDEEVPPPTDEEVVSAEEETEEEEEKEFSGYYVNINKQAKGPYEPAELRKMLKNGEITDQSSVWGEDLDSWTPIAEVEDITEVLVTDQEYYVGISGKQYGPYMFNALKIMIDGQQIDKSAKVWRTGLKDWTTIAKLPELNTKTDYEYYYEDANGETAGPYDFNKIQQLLADKQITKKTDVWRDELEDWTPLRQIPEFKSGK